MVDAPDNLQNQQPPQEEKNIEFKTFKSKIEQVIDEVINQMFQNQKYEASNMQKMVNQCSEQIIKQCQVTIGENEMKDLKLIAETIILQRGSVGFHMGGATFWETSADGCFYKKIDYDSYYVIAKVYGLSRR